MVRSRHIVNRWATPALGMLTTVILAAALAVPAQAQLAVPPARLYGSVFVGGQPAPAGTLVLAFIGATVCGSTSVGADGSYVLDVRSAAAQAGCGVDGAAITFTVAGLAAREGAVYQSGAFLQRDLSVGAPAARVAVERWARYADEPCAEPLDGHWCVMTYPLPAAREPYTSYRMLAFLRDGRVVSTTGWIVVTPASSAAPGTASRERGVLRVVWEARTPAGVAPCRGRWARDWCVEAVEVPPPLTGTVWYRLLITRPDGTTDDATGFIPAAP
jgi:hypothetical protein